MFTVGFSCFRTFRTHTNTIRSVKCLIRMLLPEAYGLTYPCGDRMFGRASGLMDSRWHRPKALGSSGCCSSRFSNTQPAAEQTTASLQHTEITEARRSVRDIWSALTFLMVIVCAEGSVQSWFFCEGTFGLSWFTVW